MKTGSQFLSLSVVRLRRTAEALLCVLSIACEAAPAFADGGPPSRINNIYHSFDHQPTQSEVTQREQAARINLDPAQLKRSTDILNELYHRIEKTVATGPASAN